MKPSIHQSACSPTGRATGQPRRRSRRRLRAAAGTVGADEVLRWPNPGRPVSEIARHSPASPTPRVGTASGTPTTTCRTPAARRSPPGDMHECWAMLPAIAAVTERVRLGSLVAPTSVHHPAVLANRAATIDHISDGRLVLGIGAGWQINEHHAYGIELEPPATRVDRFEEAIQIVRSLFDRTSARRSTARTTRSPTRRWIRSRSSRRCRSSSAPASPRMLRITATPRRRMEHVGRPRPGGERDATASLAACDTVGRDPATMRTCAQALVVVTDDADAIGEGCEPADGRAHDRRVDRRASSTRSAATPSWGSTSSSSPTGRFGDDLPTSRRSPSFAAHVAHGCIASTSRQVVRTQPRRASTAQAHASRRLGWNLAWIAVGDRVGQEASAPAVRRATPASRR